MGCGGVGWGGVRCGVCGVCVCVYVCVWGGCLLWVGTHPLPDVSAYVQLHHPQRQAPPSHLLLCDPCQRKGHESAFGQCRRW